MSSRYPGRPSDFVCPAISNPEDVAGLPWIGNFASDAPLFDAVYRWAVVSAPTYEAACRALLLAGRVGMGLDDDACAATPEFVAELCEEMEVRPVHYEIPGVSFDTIH